MHGIIDRFEQNIAVIEIEGKTADIQRELVSGDAKEGDCVTLNSDGIWVVDSEATKKRSEYIKSLMDDLWED